MSKYCLAVDIGASSGRLILGHIENGHMLTEEVHRFKNGLSENGGYFCWDTDHLFNEIIIGMKKCKEIGKIPVSIGIDTWAVDFALINKNGKLIGKTVGYRDSRTNGMDKEVQKYLSEEELYARTGIQKQLFNTIYQLVALKIQEPEQLNEAESLLMIPDYLNFRLCGVKCTEYTNATTTQLVDPKTKNWDFDLIKKLGIPEKIFCEIKTPATILGNLLPEIANEVGFDCQVILPATHDTGSAVLAIPSNREDALYISSGTWSLMGIERMEADCSEESRKANFTNEGGWLYRFRYLKNIMGLWMIQSVKKEYDDKYSFDDLCEAAEKSKVKSIVDCNDSRFLKPDSMIEAVKSACADSKQEIPQTHGDIAAVIYNSLAKCYSETAKELENITGRKFSSINIVGGGSGDPYLNKLTAKYSNREVLAGPKEATAIGNLIVQFTANGDFDGLKSARDCISRSFDIKTYNL